MLAHTVSGDGPAVVLLHGFPLDRNIWEPQVAHLSSRYRVIAPDLPGLGESPPLSGDEPPTMAGMARAMRALLDHLDVRRAAVAGHSMGGYVALALYKEAPERVSGLGLVATQARADTDEARSGRYATADKVWAEGTGVLAYGMGPKLFGPEVRQERAVYRGVLEIIRRAPAEGARAALLAMAAREDMRPRLPGVDVPTLVLTGEEDRLIPPDRSDEMAAAIPNAVLVKLAGAGHMPMLEQPDEVNRALGAWLETVDPRAHAARPTPDPRR